MFDLRREGAHHDIRVGFYEVIVPKVFKQSMSNESIGLVNEYLMLTGLLGGWIVFLFFSHDITIISCIYQTSYIFNMFISSLTLFYFDRLITRKMSH